MVNDTISDVLTRIRNAQMARQLAVRIPVSKIANSVLGLLSSEGFINSIEKKKDREERFEEFEVSLKYLSDGTPLMKELKRVSKPGRRVYKNVDELEKVHCGLGILVVSTSQGVMSDREARRKKIGGEVLAKIA